VERRPWRTVDADLLRFTTTDLRELHLAVMTAFEESAVLAPALNLDQVRSSVAAVGWDDPIDDDVLQRAMAALTGWGLLEATQDHSARYATPEEFERKNLQWSLTPRGEAAIGGVLHALDSLRHAVGLQTAVLDAIGDDLADLAELASQPRSPATDARLHITLSQVERHLAALVTSVRQFNGHLQRLLREDGTDDGIFADVKRRTVSYLEEYVEGVERPHRRLVTAIERVEAHGLASLLDRALTGANLAPVSGGDPGPAWLAERERHWQGLRVWFSPAGSGAPLIVGLLDVARTAIVELLRVLERRWDSRRRSASISHDFQTLARWFGSAPCDEDAHRLFAAAFGLWSSRHAHLRAGDGEERAPTTSWLTASSAEVAPALRTTGSLAQRGRASRIGDPSVLRAYRQRIQAEELAAHDEVRAALTTNGTVRLSTFGRLPENSFAELLALLSVGLDAPLGSDGARRALSADGRIEVVLGAPRDSQMATISTGTGVLRGPDFHVSITLNDDESSEERPDELQEAVGG
jgi:uncharacterized protein (TIGR02677 family)